MRRARPLTATLVAAVLLLSGCVANATNAAIVTADPCHAKIAYLGPLSGLSADLGLYIHEGAQLAIEQYNAKHPGCTVRLADYDSQGDQKQAPTRAQEIVADRQIVGVIGPTFSGESESADPLLNQGGVATITSSATETQLGSRGWPVFHRIIGNDSFQGLAAGRYIEDVLHARKVFVVDDTEAYGHGLATEVEAVLGDRVVQSATVLPAQADFGTVVGQIRATGADVFFFGGYYIQAGALLRQARRAGVTATFVSGDASKDEGFLNEAGPALAEGTVLTCACRPPEGSGERFADRYLVRFGRPPGTYSAEAYDAATIFLSGIAAGRLSRPAMQAYVSAYQGTGVTGPIRFTANGELENSLVKVWAYRVHDGAIAAGHTIPNS
jgi:branched-chain amino acid transport system substrate-binding protein